LKSMVDYNNIYLPYTFEVKKWTEKTNLTDRVIFKGLKWNEK
jgi:hypothetical protein